MSELKFNLKTPKVTLGVEIPVVLFGVPEIPSLDLFKSKPKEVEETDEKDKKKKKKSEESDSDLTGDEKFSLTTGALLLGSIALKALKSSY